VTVGITATQVGLMMCLILLGWVAVKAGWVAGSAVKSLTNIVLFLVQPCLVLQAFQRPYAAAELRTIGATFAVDIGVFLVMIGVARLVFARRLVADPDRRAALRFGVVYSNCGFMGVPLAQALLGAGGVMYTMVFVAVLNLFAWTHGDALIAGGRTSVATGLKRALTTPALIATVVSIIFFATSVHIPAPASDLIGYLAAVNTPLSMLIVGANLAGIGVRAVLGDRQVWAGTAVRNLLLPLIFVFLLAVIPLDPVARQATLIATACPVAAFLVMFSVRRDKDPKFGTRVLCLSTLASAVTLPAVLWLANLVW